MNKPTLGAGSLAIVGLLFIGIMLLANTLLRGAQIDLTQDRLYTLSDGTKNILRGLKEPVNLYLFFSDRTATPIPEIKNYGIRVRELLESMASRSNGKLTLKVIDPQPFSEEEDRATELGVQGVPINAGGEKLYLGLAGTNSTDGKEADPVPRSEARRAARVRRRQARAQAVERAQAGGRLDVVAAHGRRIRHAAPAGRVRR